MHEGLGFSGATTGKFYGKPAHKFKIAVVLTYIIFMGK